MNFAVSRIVVPVDFSPQSDAAFRYATAVAGRVGASVDLLHVVEEPLSTGDDPADPRRSTFREKLIRAATHELERYRTVATGEPVPLVAMVRTGQIGPTITEYAKDVRAGLIVMGARGSSGASHPFMGSVAARVVGHASCPVLTLRDCGTHETMPLMSGAGHTLFGSVLGRNGASRE